MGDLERTRTAAAHADARRRVIVRRAFGRKLLLPGAQELGRQRRAGDAQRDAVKEIAAGDGPVHSERSITLIVGRLSLVVRHWSFVSGRSSVVVRQWSFVIGRSSLVVRRWSFVFGRSSGSATNDQ